MLVRICVVGILTLGLQLGSLNSASAQTPDTINEASAIEQQPLKLNPYTGDSTAIAQGRKLYLKYNCYGCHGTLGGGGMGKPLNDEEWLYGGDDASVIETILQGRGGGMPSFKELLSNEETWKIIAYIRSYYRGDPAKVSW